MEYFDIVIGGFAIIFGVATFVLRFVRPESFGKLDAMKQRFGDKAGNAIHILAYSVLPLIFGAVILVPALQ